MIQSALQELLFDSLFTLNFLSLGSCLSLFPNQTANILHGFFAIFPPLRSRDVLAAWLYRFYGIILIGFSWYTMFRVYSAEGP
jgi:hypothetical protein